MLCSFCKNKAIYKKFNVYFCKDHFLEYFEKTAQETIEKYDLLSRKDKVGVGVSGGKDSLSLMHFLSKRKYNIVGIHVDEGIKGYRDVLTKFLVSLSKKFKWKIRIYSFKDCFGYTLDEAVKITSIKPCTICGVWRRWIFWKASLELKLDKVAVGHNMNDEVQTFMLNLMEGNFKDFLKGGPKVGVTERFFVPRVKPFFFLTEKETTIYSLIHGIYPPARKCPYISGQRRDIIRSKLYSLEDKFPGFHEKLLKSYTARLKMLKSKYEEVRDIRECSICGYPTNKEICRACELREILDKNEKRL